MHFDVITDLSYNEGDEVVYFPIDTCLSNHLASKLNCFKHSELNADKTKKGYLEDNARIKAVKLRGQYSEGVVFKVSVLRDCGFKVDFKEGEFVLQDLVSKYEPFVKEPRATKNQQKKTRATVIVEGQYPLHPNTPHGFYSSKIGLPAIVTEKLHGSQGSIGKPLVYRKLSWLEKIKKFFWLPVELYERKMIYASRKVIKGLEDVKYNHYYKTDIWKEALSPWLAPEFFDKWPDGLIIYGEVVGVTSDGQKVQSYKGIPYDYKNLIDLAIKDGYKTATPNLGFFAFRAIEVLEDGETIEYSWDGLVDICNNLGIPTVPILKKIVINAGILNRLRDNYAKGYCGLCKNKTLREGVVVRVDDNKSFTVAKVKSREFILMEANEEVENGSN
jgi:hypothetical protein